MKLLRQIYRAVKRRPQNLIESDVHLPKPVETRFPITAQT
jgi:hypothetical protein